MSSERRRRWRRRRAGVVRLAGIVLAAVFTAGSGASTLADTTIDFEQYAAGTVLTNQYADLGGVGEGVVFGPVPGGAVGEGLKPVVRTPPAGQAQSGANVADIATCPSCEFFTPRTTGTVAIPRSGISVYVGYLGEPGTCTAADPNAVACAVVRLRAYDRDGIQLAESSARVTRGAGVHTLLSVSTSSASIVGFELSGRAAVDDSKPIAIDDLTFAKPAPKPAPDFTLNPAVPNLTVVQGESATLAITIGRLNGSSGGIYLRADGLPAGVTPSFAPDPATGSQSVLTLTAAPSAPPGAATVTVTGTPQSASAGPTPRSFRLSLAVQDTCKRVSTRETLIGAVKAGYKCVFVDNNAEIDLTTHADDGPDRAALTIPEGVTLMSGRSPTVAGGLLFTRRIREGKVLLHKRVMLEVLGGNLAPDTRVAGLRLRGYNERDTRDTDDTTRAILARGGGIVIEGNEIFGWPSVGVEVADAPSDKNRAARITRNYIHNNVQCNLGYGVTIDQAVGEARAGFARIDRNVFNYNRHDVAASGGAGPGYVAELNFSLTSGPKCDPGDTFQHYNQHYDIHGKGGTAGTFIEIRRNTIRGAQGYAAGKQRRPAFSLRGTPAETAIFSRNAVHHPKALDQTGIGVATLSNGAVKVTGASALLLLSRKKLVIKNNRTCVDTARELAVGDFNGDDRDDVFQAVGTVWVYSPSGRREWFYLNESDLRLDRLALGDFDGDGKTDVFTQAGSLWLVSYGGTTQPTRLPAGSSIDMKSYRFGDFDGDGKTDVFRASGSGFFFSSGGATDWQPLAALPQKVGDLRFGDFDADGKTDVFSLANNQWSVSLGGATRWRRLNRKLSSSLGSLVFADVDGDRKTDVARSSGGKWEASLRGATPWQIRARRSESLTEGMLFGDFTGDRRDDVLNFGRWSKVPPGCWAARKGLDEYFYAFERFRLSSGVQGPLAQWSTEDMR